MVSPRAHRHPGLHVHQGKLPGSPEGGPDCQLRHAMAVPTTVVVQRLVVLYYKPHLTYLTKYTINIIMNLIMLCRSFRGHWATTTMCMARTCKDLSILSHIFCTFNTG